MLNRHCAFLAVALLNECIGLYATVWKFAAGLVDRSRLVTTYLCGESSFQNPCARRSPTAARSTIDELYVGFDSRGRAQTSFPCMRRAAPIKANHSDLSNSTEIGSRYFLGKDYRYDFDYIQLQQPTRLSNLEYASAPSPSSYPLASGLREIPKCRRFSNERKQPHPRAEEYYVHLAK
jgi:hypothetical protein